MEQVNYDLFVPIPGSNRMAVSSGGAGILYLVVVVDVVVGLPSVW